MGTNSKIEWTDHTFNPWRGCQKVSPGCDHCYAERMAKRNPPALGEWGPDGERVIASDAYWQQPRRWNKQAERDGVRRKVFCGSMMDVFEDREELRTARGELLSLVRATPRLDWLLLTKRPQDIKHLWDQAATDFGDLSLLGVDRRVWFGVTVENQAAAGDRIPIVVKVPAAVRFLSMDPLLEMVDISAWLPLIDWVIVGGESGPQARPMHPDWVRSLRDQCQAAGVPFFFKQWGEWGTSCNMAPYVMYRIGKKAAGRLLDGREWNEIPSAVQAT